VLYIFLKDIGYSDEDTNAMVGGAKCLKRDIDPCGFFTTIELTGFDFSKVENWPWGDAEGTTKNGVDVTFLIFDDNGKYLVMEGAIGPNDGYTRNDTDYEVWYYKVPLHALEASAP